MRSSRPGGSSSWVIATAVGFVVILVLGVFLASALPPIVDPLQREASAEEMIILIAYLYDREGVLANARERLNLLGEKGADQAVADLSTSYPTKYPERAREAQSLTRLAKDLAASRPAAPAAEQGGGLGLVAVLLLAIFMLLIVISFVASVSRGRLSNPLSGLSRRAVATDRSRRYRRSQDLAEEEPLESRTDARLAEEGGFRPRPPEGDEAEPSQALGESIFSRVVGQASQWWSSISSRERPARSATARSARERRTYPEEEVSSRPYHPEEAYRTRPFASPWREGAPGGAVPQAPGRLLASFQATFRVGQDPSQEVYPIMESEGAVLVGACGLGPGVALEPEHPEQYHAIIVWLHDYRNAHVLRNTVLISRGLFYDRPPELDQWLQTQPIQSALPAEPGRSATLESATLRARVTVLEVETEPSNRPNGSIGWLVLRFEVSSKGRPGQSAAGI